MNDRRGSMKINLKSSMAAAKFKSKLLITEKEKSQNETNEVGNPFLFQGIGKTESFLPKIMFYE